MKKLIEKILDLPKLLYEDFIRSPYRLIRKKYKELRYRIKLSKIAPKLLQEALDFEKEFAKYTNNQNEESYKYMVNNFVILQKNMMQFNLGFNHIGGNEYSVNAEFFWNLNNLYFYRQRGLAQDVSELKAYITKLNNSVNKKNNQ